MEDKVMQMHREGFKPKEISDKLGEGLTHQAVAKIIKGNELAVVVPSGIQTFSAEEYGDYSIANGRTRYGGEKGVKLTVSTEELRAYISSGWKPSMLMEKWQFSEEELTQLVWKLSKEELREKPIRIEYKHDFFRE